MSEKIVVDLFYLPPVEFFVALQGYDTVLIEKQDNYQKQSYRNRTAVQLVNKVELLSIPVQGGNKKVKYADVKIDDNQRWRNIHLRGIQSAYGKAPFFEYFYPELERLYLIGPNGLYDFNFELLTLCLKFLRLTVKMEETCDYQQYRGITDLRGVIKAKESFLHRNIYEPYSYMQLFGLNFVPNLSIIDLLFCEGPNSKKVIGSSKKRN
ncbi:MAG: WbqC family protein [Anditalea sp.]